MKVEIEWHPYDYADNSTNPPKPWKDYLVTLFKGGRYTVSILEWQASVGYFEGDFFWGDEPYGAIVVAWAELPKPMHKKRKQK